MSRFDVSIPCGTLMLEGILELPDHRHGLVPGAVVCHPHPLYGGNMYNNVVKALRKGFIDKGFACLRFNFRGTGASWGTHGDGVDEVDDVKAALDFLSQQEYIDVNCLVLAGYSFGCWVSLKAAIRESRPSRLIGISPPLEMYDFDFLKKEFRPKLLVVGDRDFVCTTSAFEALLGEMPEPKVGIIMPGVDHFHVGNENRLVQEVSTFLDQYPFQS